MKLLFENWRQYAMKLLEDKKNPESLKTPQVIKKAFIYGHSQTGGLGRDLEINLKEKGFKTFRSTNNSRNDSWLYKNIKKIAKRPSKFTHVFLYVGANSSKTFPESLSGMVNYFLNAGVKKENIFAILPPYHKDKIERILNKKPSKRDLQRSKRHYPSGKIKGPGFIKKKMENWLNKQKTNKQILNNLLRASNVIEVEGVWGGDEIHPQSGSQVSGEHVQLILTQLMEEQPNEDSI